MVSCPAGVRGGEKAEVYGCGADGVKDQDLCPLLSSVGLQEVQDAGLMLDMMWLGIKVSRKE